MPAASYPTDYCSYIMSEPAISSLQLKFRHKCLNTGCTEVSCLLCKNNPKRRCTKNFRDKYVDGSRKVFHNAGCEGTIEAFIEDCHTGLPYMGSETEDAMLQLCILDGNQYVTAEQEMGPGNLTDVEYDNMSILENVTSPGTPLLVNSRNAPGDNTSDFRLNLPFKAAGTPIKVRTTRSSQDVKGGRKKPYRLLARLVRGPGDGDRISNVLPAVSEPFVVTTRRVKNQVKALIPRWNDEVKVLPHVGPKTQTMLRNLRTAGLRHPLENYCIQTVGQLYELTDKAAPGLLEALREKGNLNKDNMEELLSAVRKVAKEDCRKRSWNRSDMHGSTGWLFPCIDGEIQFEGPLEIAMETGDGVEVTSTEHLAGGARGAVQEIRALAYKDWCSPGHPNWGIFEVEEGTQGTKESSGAPPELLEQQTDVFGDTEEMGPSAFTDTDPDWLLAALGPAQQAPCCDASLTDLPAVLQSSGLAYTTGSLFELNGPFRIKRSASDSRHKPIMREAVLSSHLAATAGHLQRESSRHTVSSSLKQHHEDSTGSTLSPTSDASEQYFPDNSILLSPESLCLTLSQLLCDVDEGTILPNPAGAPGGEAEGLGSFMDFLPLRSSSLHLSMNNGVDSNLTAYLDNVFLATAEHSECL